MPVDFIEEVEPTSIDFVEESPAPTLRGPSEPSIRSTLSGGPAVQTMPFTEAIQEPVETAGRMVGSTEPAIPFTKLIPSPETPTTLAERGLAMAIPGGAVASALYGPEVPVAGIRSLARGVLSVPEFLTSPLGVSTAGVASLGKVAQTLVSLGFSVDMAKSLYQQGAAAIKGWGEMTPEQKTDALVTMAQTLGFAGAAGVHGVKGAVGLLPKRPVEPAVVPPVIPPPIPKTPPPLPRLAETPDVETALRQPEVVEALTEIDKEIARAKQISPPAPGSKPTELPAETLVKETPEVAGGETIQPEKGVPDAAEKIIEQESVQPERERIDALRPTAEAGVSDSLRATTEGKAQEKAPEVLLKQEGRNWDLFNENLNDSLDAFSPARTTGRVDYDMRDVAERFVDYAKKDTSGKPLDKLVKDFADFDEASDSQIRKLRASVKNVLKEEQPTQPPSKPAEGGGVTIRDQWMNLKRTPSVKQAIRDVENGWSFVADMPMDKALAELDSIKAKWSKVLEQRKLIQQGKVDITGKDLEDMRYREGKAGKQMLPEQWAEVYGIPEAERNVAQTDSTVAALKRIQKLSSKQPATPPTAVGEGKPIGMGGAVPEEFQRVGGSPAATKFRMMDQARVARGLEPLLKPESVKDQAVLDRAMAEYDNNPAGAEKLADSLIENPRPIQDWENDYLLLRWIDTRDQFYKSAKEAQIADADGRVADLAAANGRTAEWSAAMTKLEKALRVGGSETGRALRARRVMIAEDFTLAGLETQRRAQLQSAGVSGAELERQMAEGRAELEKMASEYKATADSLKIDLENRNQRISRLEAQLELNRIKAEAAKQPYDKRVLDYAESIVKRMETAADAASTRLKERLSRMSSGVDPLILSDAAIVGAAKIARLGLNLAKFTDVMVAEYSEKMRPFMAEIWDASNKLLEANLKPENKKVKTAIKRNATITERKVDAETKIRTKIQEGKRNELTPVLRRYERILVEQGMDKLDPIVDEVHRFVSKFDPTMTRDMTMDALSGYGDFKPLSKNTVDVVVRDLHQQGQLVAKLRDMASGVSPARSGFERQPPSDIARWLTKQVEEAKKKGGYQVTSPATQLRTAMDAVHKRFQDQIADLEHQISTRQKIVRDKTVLVYDEKANQLKARRDELKEIFDEVFPKEPLTDAQRIERWNRQIDRRIADYEERIINRDFSKREKRPPPPLGPNELAKMDRLLQLKEGFNDLLLHDRYKNMKLHQKAWVAAKESFNIPRNVMASADVSAVLRQGGLLTASHPTLSAKALEPMFRGMASEKVAGIIDQEIMNRPNAKSGRYAQAKLYLSPLRSSTMSAMEEQIMSRFVHSNIFKWTGVRASNRAFITFLNKVRADSFDLLTENLEKSGNPLTDVELKAIGNYINIATGRGNMGKFAAASEAMSTILWSPRLFLSRLQYITLQPMWKGSARTRMLIAKEYARSLTGLGVVLGLGLLAGATVEYDWRSSDFGKMKFGNTRIDPMAGLSQPIVLASRTAARAASMVYMKLTGQKLLKGDFKSISGQYRDLGGKGVKYGQTDLTGVWGAFLRNKLTPVLGGIASALTGKEPGGKEVEPEDVGLGLMTPLSFGEIFKVMKAHGIPAGTAMMALSVFGMGLQYFEPKKSKASNAALIP